MDPLSGLKRAKRIASHITFFKTGVGILALGIGGMIAVGVLLRFYHMAHTAGFC